MSRKWNGTNQRFVGGLTTTQDNGQTDTASANTGKMTVAAWVKFDTLTGGNERIVSNWNGSIGWILQGQEGGAKHAKFYVQTSVLNSITGTTTLVTGTWYHYCGVYDGAHLNLYLNGAADASAVAASGTMVPWVRALPSQPAYNIASDENGTSLFVGTIGETGLWYDALTVSQITALASSKALAQHVKPQALVRYWPAWPGGNTDPDYSGNHGNSSTAGIPGINPGTAALPPPGIGMGMFRRS